MRKLNNWLRKKHWLFVWIFYSIITILPVTLSAIVWDIAHGYDVAINFRDIIFICVLVSTINTFHLKVPETGKESPKKK